VIDLGVAPSALPPWAPLGLLDSVAREARANGKELNPVDGDVAFSVVIPTRSASLDLGAIRSVLGCRHNDGETVEVICAIGNQPSVQRNSAISVARGQFVGFLDDDCLVPPNWLQRARTNLESGSASVVGGPNLTPTSSSFFSRCVGKVLSSRWGTASMRARYASVGEGTRGSGDEATALCNMVFERGVFDHFRFNESMFPNEENELLTRVTADGYSLAYDPVMTVTHPRKTDMASFAKQIFGYGAGRARQTKIQPSTLRPIHILPSSAIVGSLVCMASILSGASLAAALLGIIAMIYIGIVLLSSTRLAAGMKSIKALPLLTLLYLVLHSSYGAGFLWGLASGNGEGPEGSPGRNTKLLRFAVRSVAAG
jgi:glycosyltransferase involved in cell wall biosynthesis